MAHATSYLNILRRHTQSWPDANTTYVQAIAALTNSILARGYVTEDRLPGVSMAELESRRGVHATAILDALESATQCLNKLMEIHLDMQASQQSLQGTFDSSCNAQFVAMAPASTHSPEGIAATSGLELNSGASAALGPGQALDLACRRCERARSLLSELLTMYAAELSVKQTVLARLLPVSCTDAWRERLNRSQPLQADHGDGTGPLRASPPTSASSAASASASSVRSALPNSAGLPISSESDREHMTVLASAVAAEAYINTARISSLLEGLEFLVSSLQSATEVATTASATQNATPATGKAAAAAAGRLPLASASVPAVAAANLTPKR